MEGGQGDKLFVMVRSARPKCVELKLGNRLIAFFDQGVATQHPQNPSTQVIRRGGTITGYVYSPDLIVDV